VGDCLVRLSPDPLAVDHYEPTAERKRATIPMDLGLS